MHKVQFCKDDLAIILNNLKQMQAAGIRQGFMKQRRKAFKQREVLEDKGFNAGPSDFDDNLSAVGQRAFVDLSK